MGSRAMVERGICVDHNVDDRGLTDAQYGAFTVVEVPRSVAFVVPAHQMNSFAGPITFSSVPSHLGQGTPFRYLPRIW